MKGSVLDGRRGSCSKDAGSAFFSWLHEVESKVEGWHGGLQNADTCENSKFYGGNEKAGDWDSVSQSVFEEH